MVLEGFFLGLGDSLLLDVFLAIAFLLMGVFLGKFVAFILLRIIKATDVEKEVKPSFLKLIVAVIKWSIYVIFVNIALHQFSIPQLSEIISKVLVVIPALTASLVLIGIGFAIAIYLRGVIEDSEVTGWKELSKYIYYFVLYVFGIYSLNLALISLDSLVRNILIIVLTVIVCTFIAFIQIRKEINH
jgi:hypothetical protein